MWLVNRKPCHFDKLIKRLPIAPTFHPTQQGTADDGVIKVIEWLRHELWVEFAGVEWLWIRLRGIYWAALLSLAECGNITQLKLHVDYNHFCHHRLCRWLEGSGIQSCPLTYTARHRPRTSQCWIHLVIRLSYSLVKLVVGRQLRSNISSVTIVTLMEGCNAKSLVRMHVHSHKTVELQPHWRVFSETRRGNMVLLLTGRVCPGP